MASSKKKVKKASKKTTRKPVRKVAKKKVASRTSGKVIPLCRVADYLALDKLKLHPRNPRTIKRERLDDLKLSIRRKGLYEPLLVWEGKDIVLAGNHRLRACLELLEEGYSFGTPMGTEIPIVYEKCSEDRAWEILHESNNHYAEWVEDKVKTALQEAKAKGQDLKSFGYDEDQLQSLLAEATKQASKISKTVVGEHERSNPTKKEETRVMHFPVSVHRRLMEILREIAIQIDPEWVEDDPIDDAVKALVDFIFKNGVPDLEAEAA